MSDKYWFPSMTIPDIVQALSNWGYSVSPEQLSRPSPDFVLGIYCACLQQVTSLTQDSLQEPLESALATLEGSDMYAQAIAHSFLLYHLQRFAKAAKIFDFSSKDVSFPETERTRHVFSAFINYVKFYEQCEPFTTRLRNRSAAVLQEREKVVQQREEIQQKIATLKAKRAEDAPTCEVLRQENSAMAASLIASRQVQVEIYKEVDALKAEETQLIDHKTRLNDDMTNVKEAVNRTRSRIVKSPERIKRTIVAMSSTTIEDKKTIAMHETKTRDLQAKISALLNIEKDVRSCTEQLRIIEREMHHLDMSSKNLADLRDQLDKKKGERNELLMKRERVHKQFANAQEKMERAQRHAEEKRIASQQTIERLQREYQEMAEERRDNDKHVMELRAEAAEIERKMTEHMKTSQEELNELLAEYWKLRHQTEIYMETLANKLGMHVTST